MLSEIRTGVIVSSDGAVNPGRSDKEGCTVITDGHGKYVEQSRRQNIFHAQAIITAPVIYTTAAGTGGPLIWNGSTNKNLVILAAQISISAVTTVAGAVGLTGQIGQASAPTSTTAVDSVVNSYLGGAAPAGSAFRLGTPTNAGNFFVPIFVMGTGALTASYNTTGWVDLGGVITVPPGGWVSLAGSATLTTLAARLGLMWEEVPI